MTAMISVLAVGLLVPVVVDRDRQDLGRDLLNLSLLSAASLLTVLQLAANV